MSSGANVVGASHTPMAAGPPCQTCRYSKRRCDKQKPKCRVCQRLDAACEYRELPQKTGVSMSDLMDTLRRVEGKVDGLRMNAHPDTLDPSVSTGTHEGSQSSVELHPRPPPPPRPLSSNADHSEHESSNSHRDMAHKLHPSPKHLRVPHLVLLWPRIYSDLASSQTTIARDLNSILHEGVSWFARKEASKHKTSLLADDWLHTTNLNTSNQSLVLEQSITWCLHPEQMREISTAYFDTFNLLYPILDRRHFSSEILDVALRAGCINGNADGITLLLVLALGQVSIDGNSGTPISVVDDRPSGFRGGSREDPPGLTEFNEARRRLGFLAVDCTIEYGQIMLLQSLYYESHARHIDYWRCVVLAGSAIQGLLKLHLIDWKSFHGDQVKRAFWICATQEDFFHIDLDLPGSNIDQVEDVVPLPHFQVWQDGLQEVTPNEPWIFNAQFLALIAIRAIILRINDVMYSSEESVSRDRPLLGSGAIPVTVVREFGRQLEHWHSTLPQALHWSLSDPLDSSQDRTWVRFVSTQELKKQTYGILKTQLRTRFHYARCMLYRSFIYKALHAPHIMTSLDIEFCALAVRSFCAWPLTIVTVKDQKRLFPHLFSWTRSSIETLLILRMTFEDSFLGDICHQHVDRKEILAAASILRQWLQDLKQLDGVAEWACAMINSISMGFTMEEASADPNQNLPG